MIHRAIYGKPWYVRMAALVAVGALIVLEQSWGTDSCTKMTSNTHVSAACKPVRPGQPCV